MTAAQRTAAIVLILSIFGWSGEEAIAKKVDLRRAALAEKIISKIPTFGNEGRNWVEEFSVDDATLKVQGRAIVLARHKWGRIAAPTASNPFRKVDIAAEKEVTFSFEYDMASGDLTGDASLGEISLRAGGYEKTFGEVKIDIDLIKDIFNGNYSEIFERIPNPSPDVIRRELDDEYDTIRHSKESLHGGANNIYFASRRTVDWASPERLGEWAVSALITGKGLQDAMKQIEEKSRLELTEIQNWLSQRRITNAASVAEGLIAGRKVESVPHIELRWQTVAYKSRVIVFGNPSPWITIRHGGFYLIYTGAGGSTQASNDQPDPRNPTDAGVFVPDAANRPQPSDRQNAESRRDHFARYCDGIYRKRSTWRLGVTVKYTTGIQVVSVDPNGPAEAAGIQAGDVILEVDGSAVGFIRDRYYELSRYFSDSSDGNITLTVARRSQSNWRYFYPDVQLVPHQVAFQPIVLPEVLPQPVQGEQESL